MLVATLHLRDRRVVHGQARRGSLVCVAKAAAGSRKSRLSTVLKRAPGGDFAPSLRDCVAYIDAYPGLRCAYPGLVSLIPPGEKRKRLHLPRVGEAGGGLTQGGFLKRALGTR